MKENDFIKYYKTIVFDHMILDARAAGKRSAQKLIADLRAKEPLDPMTREIALVFLQKMKRLMNV